MNFAITHISTACVLLEIGSVRILTDPVFDTGQRRYRFAPGIAATRRLDPAMSVAEIPRLDAVLLSHPHHADNLDGEGRALLDTAREIVTASQKARFLDRPVTALRDWSRTSVFGRKGERISITATPAQHGPWWLPEARHVRGFVLEWEGQEHGALYISGDTVFFDDLRGIADRFRIGTAMLHLGAVDFWPPFPPGLRLTFNAEEAVRAAELLEPERVIPIHYEQSVWTHFKEDVATYCRAFKDAGLSGKLVWLPKGQRIEFTA